MCTDFGRSLMIFSWWTRRSSIASPGRGAVRQSANRGVTDLVKEVAGSCEVSLNTSGGTALSGFFDKRFGWNTKLLMQPANHLQRQGAFAVQDFVHAIDLPDHRNQIFWRECHLLHAKFDRFNRIGQIKMEVPFFIGFEERNQYVQTLTL